MSHTCRLFAALLCIALLNGCDNLQPGNDITGLWNFNSQGGKDSDLEEDAYLNLCKDKTYTFYQPYYFDHGHWSYSDKKIKMVSDRKHVLYLKEWEIEVTDREKDVLKVKMPYADKVSAMPAPAGNGAKEKIMYTVRKNVFLEKNNVQFAQDKDPYSLKYSMWRIHPEHKESCAEVQQRLAANLMHLYLLFDQYSHSESESVSWKHSPNPFVMNSNGISIENNSQLPERWTNLFYDTDNESDAYNMLVKLFDEDLDIPLHYKKYSELWAPMLKQMQEVLVKKDMCKEIQK